MAGAWPFAPQAGALLLALVDDLPGLAKDKPEAALLQRVRSAQFGCTPEADGVRCEAVLTADSAEAAQQGATMLIGLKAMAQLKPDPAIDAIGRAVIASGNAVADGARVRITANVPYAAMREQMAAEAGAGAREPRR